MLKSLYIEGSKHIYEIFDAKIQYLAINHFFVVNLAKNNVHMLGLVLGINYIAVYCFPEVCIKWCRVNKHT